MNAKILIVEDDDLINNMIKEALEQDGFSCMQAFPGPRDCFYLKQKRSIS